MFQTPKSYSTKSVRDRQNSCICSGYAEQNRPKEGISTGKSHWFAQKPCCLLQGQFTNAVLWAEFLVLTRVRLLPCLSLTEKYDSKNFIIWGFVKQQQQQQQLSTQILMPLLFWHTFKEYSYVGSDETIHPNIILLDQFNAHTHTHRHLISNTFQNCLLKKR